jgi:hypothetical protein
MFRRLWHAVEYAAKEGEFFAVFGSAFVLIVVGTVTYALAEGWSIANAFYFSICTLTTSSIADPELTLHGSAIKVFTAFYVLLGIGILVELARQIGFGYVKMRSEQGSTRRTHRAGSSERSD